MNHRENRAGSGPLTSLLLLANVGMQAAIDAVRMRRASGQPGQIRCDISHMGKLTPGFRSAKNSLSTRRGCRSRCGIGPCYPQLSPWSKC